MNELTAEQLQQVKELAELFFTPRQVAQMLELPADAFVAECEITGSDIYRAFYSGRLQGEVDLRKAVLKMSKAGSTPAQAMAMDLLKSSTLKMLDE